jgi:hypothetical protein
MVAATVDPARLVFVEDIGINTSLSAIYAYSQEVIGHTPAFPATEGQILRYFRA